MKNLTDITVLLDRSGSMESIRTDTVGGLNAFIREQQALPGEARFTLIQFDSISYDKVIDATRLAEVKPLAESDFKPRDCTPLLDSMARMINETGARLDAMPEADRPDKVVAVIITDGLENASKEFSRPQVFDKVKHQTDAYQWLFLYLGANQDAISVGAGLGIAQQHAATYAPTAKGTNATYRAAACSVSALRSGVPMANISYTAADRAAMADDENWASGTSPRKGSKARVYPKPSAR